MALLLDSRPFFWRDSSLLNANVFARSSISCSNCRGGSKWNMLPGEAQLQHDSLVGPWKHYLKTADDSMQRSRIIPSQFLLIQKGNKRVCKQIFLTLLIQGLGDVTSLSVQAILSLRCWPWWWEVRHRNAQSFAAVGGWLYYSCLGYYPFWNNWKLRFDSRVKNRSCFSWFPVIHELESDSTTVFDGRGRSLMIEKAAKIPICSLAEQIIRIAKPQPLYRCPTTSQWLSLPLRYF